MSGEPSTLRPAPPQAGVPPNFRRITAIVARSLSLSSETLLASFTPATAEHLPAVVALRRAVFAERSAPHDLEYLAWRYHFGDPRRGRGDCWVLVLGAAVIAMVGTEEIVLCEGAREVRAASTMDIAVHPDYEGVGLGGWMNLRICASVGCALTIGSNERSRSMISRTFRRLPDRRSYVHVLRFEPALARRLGSRPLVRQLASLSDTGGRLLRGIVFATAGRGYELRPIERFGASLGPLIARARPPRERWIGRSIEFLNWRLFDNPRMRCAVTGAYAAGELVGFIATHLRGGGMLRRRLMILDWLVDARAFAPILRALCAAALREAIRGAAEAVWVTAYHPPAERLLRRWGFLARANSYETLAVCATDPATLGWLEAPACWFVTEANTDRDGA